MKYIDFRLIYFEFVRKAVIIIIELATNPTTHPEGDIHDFYL